jgi:branched-chain amino acid aminotransferase
MGNKLMLWRSRPLTGRPVENVPVEPTASVDETTRRLPPGGYTTFRTYGSTQALRLDDHFERLEEAARLVGRPLALDRERVRQDLRRILRHILSRNPSSQARVRVVVDLEDQPGTLYYLVEALRIPSSEEYERGVDVVTRRMQRENPLAKLTRFVETADSVRQQLPPGTNEALMVGSAGTLLEGLSSNFFAVHDGVVRTAGEGVLPGITRSLVIETIGELGIPLRMEAVHLQDLDRLQEAFLTSASRAVLPVRSIDGLPVGSGRPGAVTRKILARYTQRLETELETI